MTPAAGSGQIPPPDVVQRILERVQSEAVRVILDAPTAFADLWRVVPGVLETSRPWQAPSAAVIAAVIATFLLVRRVSGRRRMIAARTYSPLLGFFTLAGLEFLALACASLAGRILLVRWLQIPPGSTGAPTQATLATVRWLLGVTLAVIVFQPRFPKFRLLPVDDMGAVKAVRTSAILLAIVHGHVMLLGLAEQAGLTKSSAELFSILLTTVLSISAIQLIGSLRHHRLSAWAWLLTSLLVLAVLLLWIWGWFASDFSAYRGAVDAFAVLLLALAFDRAVAITSNQSRSLNRMRLLFVLRIVLDAAAAAVILRIVVGFWIIGPSAWLSVPDWPGFARRLDLAFAMLVLGVTVAALIHVWTDATLTRAEPAAATVRRRPSRLDRLSTVLPILRFVLIGFVTVSFALAALAAIGVDVTPLVAGAGLIGLTMSLGFQALVKDVAAGIFTALDDVFRLGEDIESNGKRGQLERINMRSIQLRDQNGCLHTIPLGELGAVTNHSRRLVRMVAAVTLDAVPSRADLTRFKLRATEMLHSEPAFHAAAVGGVLLEVAEPADAFSASVSLSFNLIAMKAAGLDAKVQRLLEEAIADLDLAGIVPVANVSIKDQKPQVQTGDGHRV